MIGFGIGFIALGTLCMFLAGFLLPRLVPVAICFLLGSYCYVQAMAMLNG